jgi:hypothetical protein
MKSKHMLKCRRNLRAWDLITFRRIIQLLLVTTSLVMAQVIHAQSPNTATIIVVVVDQADAVIRDAKVSVVNAATGASREAVSDSDGNATFSALSLTGTYTVTVAREGFGNEEQKDITLRSGETATLRVKLKAGAANAEVTVFGTAEGVRADAQIGVLVRSPLIDETPILGRKSTTLPLLNSAFRQGKGTGDLFVNTTYYITGVGSRRATTFTLDGANNEGWGLRPRLPPADWRHSGDHNTDECLLQNSDGPPGRR